MDIKLSNNAPILQPKREPLWLQYKKHWKLFILLVPVLIYFLIFHYVPMWGVQLAFRETSWVNAFGGNWIGFQYFYEMFTGMFFLRAFRNTLIISFYRLVFGFPAPIILALLLNEVYHLRFKKFIQSVSYLPHFISWVVLTGILIEFLAPDRGVVNYIIASLGGNPIHFIADPRWFRFLLVASGIWRNVGFQSIIFLAAISGIDPELYDVAEIDGAKRFRKIWSITLPSIKPTIAIMLIFAIGGIIQDDFEQIFNMLNGMVLSVGDVIGTYTYEVGIRHGNFGYGTAVGLFRSVIAMIMLVTGNLMSRKLFQTSLW